MINVSPCVAAALWRRPLLRPIFLFLFLAFLTPSLSLAAHAATRGEAQISIFVDLTATSRADEISFRLMGNRDKQVLEEIVDALVLKFSALPKDIRYVQGNEDLPSDKSAGVTLRLPIVPRGEEYLPIAPFIEAFAPYASRMRIVYYVAGPFNYRGFKYPYNDKNVTITVDLPQKLGGNSAKPLAFYAVDVMIKNPSLRTIDLPAYPDEPQKSTGAWRSRIVLAVGAAIIIIALGLMLGLLLPRRKAGTTGSKSEQEKDSGISTGGNHD